MKKALSHIAIFLIGAVVAFFARPYIYEIPKEIVTVKEIQYETEYKVNTKEITFQEAIGCIESPITITHKFDDNWLKITAEDKCKKSIKDIEFKIKSSHGNWNTELVVGSVALVMGACIMAYSLR